MYQQPNTDSLAKDLCAMSQDLEKQEDISFEAIVSASGHGHTTDSLFSHKFFWRLWYPVHFAALWFFFFGSACTYIFRGTTANFHSWCEWAHMSGRARIWYFLSLQLLFSTSLSKNADRHEHFQRHYRLLGCIFAMHYLQSLLHSCFQAGYCKGR